MIPSWTAWTFAAAGALFALGPIVIHLLNRRRFRVVHWAAMDFLREAVERSRRMLQLRDLLLMILRTAAVLLFGLALARPYWSPERTAFDASQPLHAVLVIDNSLSMAYDSLGVTLLDRAKQRAREFLDTLPSGSRISVVPLCGLPGGFHPDPYHTRQDARAALDRVEVVDRGGSLTLAANAARRACERLPNMAWRIVLFSDQQLANWRGLSRASDFQGLPEMQLVSVAAESPENIWLSSFYVQDGIADAETPTTLVAELRHQGSTARRDVPVTLEINGAEVATRTVSLEPGDAVRQVTFHQVLDMVAPEPGKCVMVPARVSIPSDRLPADDQRVLVVPVVAALPVVFVDQFGGQGEDPAQGRYGETRHLRRLLVPVTQRDETRRALVQIRHVTIDQLTAQLLEDVRLVVVAGVPDPGGAVPLLREFVLQGGQLLVAAGAGFEPDTWSARAWLEGRGILPAPLAPEPVGALPDEGRGTLRPFFLNYASMKQHACFQLAGVAQEELADLYAEPFFFKAVRIDLGPAVEDAAAAAERERLKELRTLLDARRATAPGDTPPTDVSAEAAAVDGGEWEERSRELAPDWLLWARGARDLARGDVPPAVGGEGSGQLDTAARGTLPRVLARFDNQLPFIVERSIGQGRVVFVASGLLSGWNTLPKTNAMLILDRMLRGMLQATLPPSNFPALDNILVPVEIDEPDVVYALTRPEMAGQSELLQGGYLGTQTRGVVICGALTRGIYHLAARRMSAGAERPQGPGAPLWETSVAVNGDPLGEESDLTSISEAEFRERAGSAPLRWVGPGQTISLAGPQVRGQDGWWYLVLAVLGMLLVEMLILAWSHLGTPRGQAHFSAAALHDDERSSRRKMSQTPADRQATVG